MKICSICKLQKAFEEFNRKGEKYQQKCRICQKAWYKNYYENSEREKDRLASNRSENREAIDIYVREAKNVPCVDCNIKYPYYVMDFDHIGEKKFNIGGSKSNKTLARIKEEIAKCEVVCSNCHRIRTHKRRENGKVYSRQING